MGTAGGQASGIHRPCPVSTWRPKAQEGGTPPGSPRKGEAELGLGLSPPPECELPHSPALPTPGAPEEMVPRGAWVLLETKTVLLAGRSQAPGWTGRALAQLSGKRDPSLCSFFPTRLSFPVWKRPERGSQDPGSPDPSLLLLPHFAPLYNGPGEVGPSEKGDNQRGPRPNAGRDIPGQPNAAHSPSRPLPRRDHRKSGRAAWVQPPCPGPASWATHCCRHLCPLYRRGSEKGGLDKGVFTPIGASPSCGLPMRSKLGGPPSGQSCFPHPSNPRFTLVDTTPSLQHTPPT